MTVRMQPFAGQPRANWKPGMIRRDDDVAGHHYVCPCGCQGLYYAQHAVQSGSVETGDLTLTPSLHHNGPGHCGWHGWLRDGEFVDA